MFIPNASVKPLYKDGVPTNRFDNFEYGHWDIFQTLVNNGQPLWQIKLSYPGIVLTFTRKG